MGPVVELRPMVGLISAEDGNQSPITWERLRSPGGGRNGSQFETHFDRNLHQIEGSFDCVRLWPETLAISRFL